MDTPWRRRVLEAWPSCWEATQYFGRVCRTSVIVCPDTMYVAKPFCTYYDYMDTRPLGTSGLLVGALGVGTWRAFDVSPDSADSVAIRARIVDVARAEGVSLYDSSPMYGRAEEVLALVTGEIRQSVQIATKVWSPDLDQGRNQIVRALHLYSGLVDVYQIHNLVGWRQYLPILKSLRDEGKVAAVGVTHYSASAMDEICAIMSDEQIDTVQVPYNPLELEVTERLLSLAHELNIGVLVMSPLGSGALVRSSPPAAELKSFAAFGVYTWAQILIKWVLSDPRVHCALVATSRPERMGENAQAAAPPWFGDGEREKVVFLAQQLEGR